MTKVERDWNSCGTKDSFFTDGSSIGLNGIEGGFGPEVLALNHESRILGQWSNPLSGSRKSQASSLGPNSTESDLFLHGVTTYRVGQMSENPTLVL